MNKVNPLMPSDLNTLMNDHYASQQPDPAFSDRLEKQLRQHHEEMTSTKTKTKIPFLQKLRARPMLVILYAVLAFVVLSAMVYVLGRMTGFIPGFGFTSQDNPVFVLAEPLQSDAGGVEVNVEQAVNDGESFWMEMTISGVPEEALFTDSYTLYLEDETVPMEACATSGSSEDEIMLHCLFASTDDRLGEITLLIENLGGQRFEIPLKLRPIRSDELVPVPSVVEDVHYQSEVHAGVRLVLEHVAVDSSKTVFQVSLHYDHPNTWVMGQWSVTLSDESGAMYPLTDVTPDTMTSGNTHVYQTLPFTGSERLILTLVMIPPTGTLSMFADFSGDSSSFMFDPGADLTAGQTWDLDQDLSGKGLGLKVVKATLTDEPGLVFEAEPGPNVSGFMVYSPDPLLTGSTGGVPVHSGNVTAGITFSELPEHPFKVQLMRIYYQAEGSWQIHWQPPAAASGDMDAAEPTARPTLLTLPTQTPAVSDPLLLEVQLLAQKFDAPFQQGPGWNHVIKETLTNLQAGQTFPPPYLKTETWYEIDREGYILQSVLQDYDDSGQVIQLNATIGNYSTNFTTGDSGFYGDTLHRFSLDLFTNSLSSAVQYGSNITREEVVCDNGSPCLLITLQDSISPPVQNPGESQAFSGSGQRVWIDSETGQQVKSQSFWLLVDGSERATWTQETTLVEKVDNPPQYILDILSKIVVP